ncbi:MAG: ABC-F family ATP-binding cassette domain-containing protein [Clostridia bacterium]|nr:ABC-F family ATP-binding cassette domain-containing protein [Clostridia bacterium]
MSELAAQGLSFSFGENVILKDASFELQKGEKAGLVGPNGSGKTTLLNLIYGKLTPDAGSISIKNGSCAGLLEQLPSYPESTTVLSVLLSAFDALNEKKAEIDKIAAALEAGEPADVKRLGELQTAFESAGGYEQDLRLKLAMRGLSISEEMAARPFMRLSGGEKTRVNLARIMLSSPDILLLDEPTNHLDVSSVEWLEDTVKSFKGAVLIVSHDRYFLDKVTTRTLELYDNKIVSYPGNYSYFAEKRSEQQELLEKAAARQEKEISRLVAASERMKIWGRGNKRVMKKAFAIQKRIERMERIRTIKRERKINAGFTTAARSGDEVLTLCGLSIGYGSLLLSDFTAQVLRGERIAVIGANGCGKTTLLETLTGEKPPLKGYVYEGAGVKKGYLPQVVSFAAPQRNVLDTVLFETGCTTQEARDRLAVFGFRGEDVFKTVSSLSGGEKTRLKLCLFMGKSVNTLFLDEPTNHLDLMSRSWVEDAIDDFSETLIFVSHDRYFIDRFATRIWQFEDGKIFDFDGGWEAYREYLKRQEELKGAAMPKQPKEKKPAPERAAGDAPRGKLSQKEIRQLNAKKALLEKELSEVSAEIEASVSDYIKLGELLPRKDTLETQLLEIYEALDT